MTESRQFAVGDWEYNGFKCPINTAECADSEWAEELGEEFDSLARQQLDGITNKSVIREEEAKEVWNTLKNMVEERSDWDYDSEHAEMYRQMLELAEHVEDELEWQ